jgi:hypothetical protein
MKLDGKTIYAQSSDIKSRTYLEYRRDMKKKAIGELEVLEWLEDKVKELYLPMAFSLLMPIKTLFWTGLLVTIK